ncbi:MAG: hypothetical protein M1813_005390 [Trichoglossum hirsutum]|nr:MAG: hypothetical protein M1813_005390 [Trichoglossum hirsutum]
MSILLKSTLDRIKDGLEGYFHVEASQRYLNGNLPTIGDLIALADEELELLCDSWSRMIRNLDLENDKYVVTQEKLSRDGNAVLDDIGKHLKLPSASFIDKKQFTLSHEVVDGTPKMFFVGSDELTNVDFEKTDMVLILDSCYSGQATRGFKAAGRSVEIICSVSANQKALENASDLARVQNRTFTCRLADAVAQHVSKGDSSSISFVDIVEELRGKSLPDRLPEYSLHVGRVGIRVPILGQARLPPHLRAYCQIPSRSFASDGSFTAVPETPHLTAVFSVHLDNISPSSEEIRKLVKWLHALNSSIGLELTGIHRSRSTVLVIVAPWRVWAQLKGLPGLELVCESFGQNLLPRFSE